MRKVSLSLSFDYQYTPVESSAKRNFAYGRFVGFMVLVFLVFMGAPVW